MTASTSATWGEVGLITANTVEVYASNNGNPVSWRPNKTINTLKDTGIVAGKGYQINAKLAMDKNEFFTKGVLGVLTLS